MPLKFKEEKKMADGPTRNKKKKKSVSAEFPAVAKSLDPVYIIGSGLP
jgi:hypothetical protein